MIHMFFHDLTKWLQHSSFGEILFYRLDSIHMLDSEEGPDMHMVAEIRTFLIMLGGGIAVSGLYDLYRWLWLRKHWRGIGKHLGDGVFVLFAGVVLVGLLFFSNWGELRSYVFFGLGIGILFYFKIIKAIFHRFI